MSAASPTPFEVVVRERRDLADGILELTLASVGDEPLPGWEPGAHIGLELGNGLVRQYSLCGDVNDPTWRIGVLREPHGRGGSAYVHDEVRAGDRIEATGPTNHFRLVDSESYVFIAGGIGITPILPMLADAERRGALWHLYYGGRRRSSMAYVETLVERYGDKVSVLPEDEVGLLPLKNILHSVDTADVYCCGPEPLITAVEQRTASHPGLSLHVERFTPIEVDTSGDTEFEVVLDRRGLTLKVAHGGSILDVVEREGIAILSSCREGTCGTCETEVLEGEVEHRDAVLTPEEHESNEVMMICVSRAKCSRLVLDL